MVAVVRVDAELVDDFVGVFAPVFDIDEGVVQRRAIIAGEGIYRAKGLGSGENILCDDLDEKAGELAIGEADAIQSLELFAKILLQRSAVGDVRAVLVFELLEGADKAKLDVLFPGNRCFFSSTESIGRIGGGMKN